jgi:conjugal transfer pilus assembly protein TraW
MRANSFIFLIILLVPWFSVVANAEDLGKFGTTWPVAEENPVEFIQNKLKNMEADGTISSLQQELAEQVKQKIRIGSSLDIPNTQTPREYEYDPSIIVQDDIKDHLGRVIHVRGTKINPLDHVSMPYELLFFNGNAEDQLQWALNKHEEAQVKPLLILVAGSALALDEKYEPDFYFDQEGVLIKKFGIQQVPCVVGQVGKKLVINEIKLQEIKR